MTRKDFENGIHFDLIGMSDSEVIEYAKEHGVKLKKSKSRRSNFDDIKEQLGKRAVSDGIVTDSDESSKPVPDISEALRKMSGDE